VNDAIQAEIKKRDLSATNVKATARLVDRDFLPRYKVSQCVLLARLVWSGSTYQAKNWLSVKLKLIQKTRLLPSEMRVFFGLK